MPDETELTSPLGADRFGEREQLYENPTEELYRLLDQTPSEADRKRSDIVYDDEGLHHVVKIGYDHIVAVIRLNEPVSDGTADFAMFIGRNTGFSIGVNYSRIFFDVEPENESVLGIMSEINDQVEYIENTEYDEYFVERDEREATLWVGDSDDDLKGWIRERVEDRLVN